MKTLICFLLLASSSFATLPKVENNAYISFDGDGLIFIIYEGHYYIGAYPSHYAYCPGCGK